eukprot:989391-Rhodomonas_salina.2
MPLFPPFSPPDALQTDFFCLSPPQKLAGPVPGRCQRRYLNAGTPHHEKAAQLTVLDGRVRWPTGRRRTQGTGLNRMGGAD